MGGWGGEPSVVLGVDAATQLALREGHGQREGALAVTDPLTLVLGTY